MTSFTVIDSIAVRNVFFLTALLGMTHITILLQYTIEIENARYSKNNY